mmetsp:Transcript_67010/g.132128  ORF Transcript_67010/g.132128 Transcript_67010/m.132128 type:complete len:200 (+) Transcript_67010:40-639(+)|eukprot:CAMPEP_0172821604 /NCGR_PEP_ID=MMETSP1075-20121228/16086_1 /TAXON_ID=2916 /ORGANISM="Ceratium fusus, Strain PA161109" /LENGTH=199 /DNA_ID=CAMNT_0013662473 /DNA_START=40 /DNA_END=639 /DNA_ORIENTATION=-
MAAIQFSALQVEEEPLEVYMDNLSMLHHVTEDDSVGHIVGDGHGSHHNHRRWRILGAVAFIGCGLAVAVLGFSAQTKMHALTADFKEANDVQAKFSESEDSWQAPEKQIRGSELWDSCGTYMTKCGGHCCCERGYYWRIQPTAIRRSLQKKVIGRTTCVAKARVPTHIVRALDSASQNYPGTLIAADSIGSSDTWGSDA